MILRKWFSFLLFLMVVLIWQIGISKSTIASGNEYMHEEKILDTHYQYERYSNKLCHPLLRMGKDFRSVIVIRNVQNKETNLLFQAYDCMGNLLSIEDSIVALKALETRFIDLGDLPHGVETIELEADTIISSTIRFLTKKGYISAEIPAVALSSQQLDFPETFEDDIFSKEIVLRNPYFVPVEIKISAFNRNGKKLGETYNEVIQPKANHIFSPSHIFDENVLMEISSVSVDSGSGINGLQVADDNNGGSISSLPGLIDISKSWTLIFEKNKTVKTRYLGGVLNPGDLDTSIRIEALDKNLNSIGIINSEILKPRSTLLLQARKSTNQGDLLIDAYAIKITSDLPVKVYKVPQFIGKFDSDSIEKSSKPFNYKDNGNIDTHRLFDSQTSKLDTTSASYAITGYVKNENRKGVQGLTVCVVKDATWQTGACLIESTITNSDGYYEITGLAGNDTYALKVNEDDRNKRYFYKPVTRDPSSKEIKANYAPNLVRLIYVGTENVSDVNFKKITIPEAKSGFVPPMEHEESNRGFTFGQHAYYPDNNFWVYHPGQDYNNSANTRDTTPVFIVADGVVVDVRRDDDGGAWGGAVIKHWYREQAYYSQYGHIKNSYAAHNQSKALYIGQKVLKGERIGYEDCIPCSANPVHLHFEIRTWRHPYPYCGSFYKSGNKYLNDQDKVYKWYTHPDAFIESSKPYWEPLTIVIDERDSGFSSFGYFRHDKPSDTIPGDIGYGGHMQFTYTIDSNSPEAWGKWSFKINQAGYYKIEVYIPRRREEDKSTNAIYYLDQFSSADVLRVDQSNVNDDWVSLGSDVHFLDVDVHSIQLFDTTGEVNKRLVYDAIRLSYVDPLKPKITSFTINSCSEDNTNRVLPSDVTYSREVTLDNSVEGYPRYYIASEDPTFQDTTWKNYSKAPKFILSENVGRKTVYLKVRSFLGESPVKQDKIDLKKDDTPIITSFTIDNGNALTKTRPVTLNNTVNIKPNQYKASEDPSFRNEKWKNYSEKPTFILSEGNGEKKVYFKVKIGEIESAVVSDTIELTQNTKPVVTSFAINNGASTTTNQTVTLNNTSTESPDYYMASEDPGFNGAQWQNYAATPPFTLSNESGQKKVFFKVKGITGVSEVVSDTIIFNQGTPSVPIITSFTIDDGSGYTSKQSVTLFNTASPIPDYYKASEDPGFAGATWRRYVQAPTFPLSSAFGEKVIYFKVKNDMGVSYTVSEKVIKHGIYTAEPSSTSRGGGTWGAILRLSASISGPELTLTATKADGSAWITSGTLYFKVGSMEPYGFNRKVCSATVGDTSFEYKHNLADYTGQYPKEFYVRYEPYRNPGEEQTFAWVGPIYIHEK